MYRDPIVVQWQSLLFVWLFAGERMIAESRWDVVGLSREVEPGKCSTKATACEFT